MKTNILISIMPLCILLSCSQKKDEIYLLPGQGIVLNNDSLLINKIDPDNVAKLIDIKDTFDIVERQLCTTYDTSGNLLTGSYFIKNII